MVDTGTVDLARTAKRHNCDSAEGETGDKKGRVYNALVPFGPDGGWLTSIGRSTIYTRRGWASDFIQVPPVQQPGGLRVWRVWFGLMISGCSRRRVHCLRMIQLSIKTPCLNCDPRLRHRGAARINYLQEKLTSNAKELMNSLSQPSALPAER